jgi:hypothetical protein
MVSRSLAFVLILFSAYVFVSCEDPLPPYLKPENIFVGGFSSIDTFTVRYGGDLDPLGTFSYSGHNTFVMGVQNVYEETIQSQADISGKLEIWLPSNPDIKATMLLTNVQATGINGTDVFDRTRNLLTINPGQSFYLRAYWNYKMDDGKWVNQDLENYTQIEYRNLNYYRIHDPTPFHARLTVSLIKNTSIIVADTTFTLHLIGDVYYRP